MLACGKVMFNCTQLNQQISACLFMLVDVHVVFTPSVVTEDENSLRAAGLL